MSKIMTVKLENSNYIVWKHQISMVLETYSLMELLNGTQTCPDQFLKDSSGVITSNLNPEFQIWKSKEKTLLTFICSTLSPTTFTLTMGCNFAQAVWELLENHFSSVLRFHIINLKGEIHNIKKGTGSVDVYLQRIKVVREKIRVVGILIDDEELVHIALKGLSKIFNSFRSAIRTRSSHLTFDELITLLNAEEESSIESVEIKDAFALATANYKPKNANFKNSNQSRGRDSGNNSPGERGQRNNSLGERGRRNNPSHFQGQGQYNQSIPKSVTGPILSVSPSILFLKTIMSNIWQNGSFDQRLLS